MVAASPSPISSAAPVGFGLAHGTKIAVGAQGNPADLQGHGARPWHPEGNDGASGFVEDLLGVTQQFDARV